MKTPYRPRFPLVPALGAAAAVLLGAAGAAMGQSPYKGEVAVVALEGALDAGSAASFGKRLEQAAGEGRTRFVIVEMGVVAGSDLEAGRAAAAAVGRLRRVVETVAHLGGEVSGAAALVALACNHLAMAPGARLSGEASPELAKELAPRAGERGYPRALAAALADGRERVIHVRYEDFETGAPREEYLTDARLAAWPPGKRRRVSVQETAFEGGGKLLQLDHAEASRFGFARWVVRSRGELVAELEARVRGPLVVRDVGPGAIEGFLAWAARSGLLPFFLFAGLLGVLIEVYHPGLVVPGALGVVCVAVALSGGHVAGLTSTLDLALIAVGIVLLLLEMFVIPGFGVTGVAGILCLLGGAFLGMQENVWPATEAESAQWRAGLRDFAIGVVFCLGGFAAAVRLLPRSPVLSRLVHASAQKVEDGYTVASASRVALLGRRGAAATDLRPAGKIAIEDEVLDAVSDGGWIERGAAVEVVDTSENRLVVKKA